MLSGWRWSAFFARGHLLIEGVPGVGKTTLGQLWLAPLIAAFSGCSFTSDMLPSDLLGISVYSALDQEFRVQAAVRVYQCFTGGRDQPHYSQDQSALLER